MSILSALGGPVNAAAIGLLGAREVGQLAEPLTDAIFAPGRSAALDRQANELRTGSARGLLQEQQVRGEMAKLEAILMQDEPHLLSEILAGKRLAKGSRVYGATDRSRLNELLRDLVEGKA